MVLDTPIAGDIATLNVLVLDEFKYMRNLIHSMLERSSDAAATYTATTAEAAFDDLCRLRPDLVITDWNIDFVNRVRRSADSPIPDVPIIMLTGHAELPLILKARDAGVNEFLAKPVSTRALFSRIGAILRNPRPFIRCPAYVGPDRRRRDFGPPDGGEERRRT